jgi:hypothetical protein
MMLTDKIVIRMTVAMKMMMMMKMKMMTEDDNEYYMYMTTFYVVMSVKGEGYSCFSELLLFCLIFATITRTINDC